ncbi:MAG: VWA domain-containing protein [Elusimicrobiota bacterium]|nr:VWA domain-containing protein [Endomicrobiia bacterium]MDW8165069.1 VWA domain-containing protein [Elusimicrobiota bacterium]
MIYFYNKFLLLLLPLALFPILLHLLFEKKSKTIKFTYLNLIHRILTNYSFKRRIIDIVVMILRCLIITFVILFFAVPIIYFNPSKKHSMNLILALDTSFSMQQKISNTNKLNLCKLYLLDLIKELREYNVKFKIITFDESINLIYDGYQTILNEKAINDKILNISDTFKSTNLALLIEYLESNFNFPIDKIIVFTDLANHILEFSNFKEKENSNKFDILFCYPNYVDANFYIESIKFSLNREEDILELMPKIISSTSLVDKINVKLFINNEQIDSRNISFSQNSRFNYILGDKNLIGYFNLPNDAINGDNNFYFSFQVNRSQRKILCFLNEPIYVKGIDSKKFYIENLSSSEFYVKVIPLEEKEFFIDDLDGYDCVMSVDVKDIESIERYLDNGNITKIFFIDEHIDIQSYEKFFNGIEFIETQRNISGFNLSLTDEDEEFKKFFEKFEYKNIKIFKRHLLNVVDKENWKTILKFSDGYPAVLNNKNTYLFSFSIYKDDSNYVYKPLFISFINFILKKEDFKIKQKPYYFISEPILLGEDNINSIIPIVQNRVYSNNYYEKIFGGIKFYLPGIYKFNLQKNNEIYIAINTPPKESSIELVNKSELRKELLSTKKFNNINFIDILKKNSKEFILQWCFGKEFSKEVLTLVIVFLILETILSRLGGRNL